MAFLTQDDIRAHYETNWRKAGEAGNDAALVYSSAVEDGVLYPIYQSLIRIHAPTLAGGSARLLDIDVGAGRWLRFFCERYPLSEYVGIDFAQASIDLLKDRAHAWIKPSTKLRLAHGDITDPSLPLLSGDAGRFDLVNIANVLFHIPEQDKFQRAMANLAALVSPTGCVATTEYLPVETMRTPWMMVRSRDEFAAAADRAGLRIVDVRATGFFNNDPCGISGNDDRRAEINRVRQMQSTLLSANMNENARAFMLEMFVAIERATLDWARGVVNPADMPTQKLVVLKRK